MAFQSPANSLALGFLLRLSLVSVHHFVRVVFGRVGSPLRVVAVEVKVRTVVDDVVVVGKVVVVVVVFFFRHGFKGELDSD